ncbi:MAG: tRNA (adenosine(37)-N6)-threonylcarbamoyltransferase complex ATPase subunit type 1 TsaE [Treponema sp.]|nr:tRNA (adenosine(37)-N6)-threonylcarbamoyltransferase complex ATPase subunit type 1 TsaE [Treponema sp.]
MLEIISSTPEETKEIGIKIASHLGSGSVVALEGTLGSGKTYLTKGIALGLGIEETLTSPTYTIVNEYEREDLPALYHIDVYRLKDERDFSDIGGSEIINGKGISVIEWSDRILKLLPAQAIFVSLVITGNESRLIKINGLNKL